MRHRLEVDVRTPIGEAPARSHNRWHPAIPPVLSVVPGDEVELDLRDGLDCQVRPGTTAAELAGISTARGHPLTGPILVEGARPGDLLEVDVLAIDPDSWGYTVLVPGFGVLAERFPEPVVVEWELRDGVARSPQLPGVAVRGAPFLGVVGVAPSPERLAEYAAREAQAGGPPPEREGAVPVGSDGLRTIPPREVGGNLDVRQVTAGSRLVLPVDVEGALLSVGDAHFAQGDGEVCGVAIEMAARAVIRVGLRRDPRWRPGFPVVEFAEGGRRFLATTGLGAPLDATAAARAALQELLGYLTAERGLSPEQAYVLASACADLRISELVDVPNALVAAILPLDVFEAERPLPQGV